MKKIGLLVVAALFAVSCNTKPGGNKGVLQVEHEPYTAEDVHHAEHSVDHEVKEEHAKEEVQKEIADSVIILKDSVK